MGVLSPRWGSIARSFAFQGLTPLATNLGSYGANIHQTCDAHDTYDFRDACDTYASRDACDTYDFRDACHTSQTMDRDDVRVACCVRPASTVRN